MERNSESRLEIASNPKNLKASVSDDLLGNVPYFLASAAIALGTAYVIAEEFIRPLLEGAYKAVEGVF